MKYIELNSTLIHKKNIKVVNAIDSKDMEDGMEYHTKRPHLLIQYSDTDKLICISFENDRLLNNAYSKLYKELM